jgi:hypothetical protein
MNREGWLTIVGRKLEEVFTEYKFPPYRVTCGWPSHGAIGKKTIVGQCFDVQCSKDGVHEIFISPLLDKPLEVAGTLGHEMAHCIAGIKAAHGKKFIAICNELGLTKGKPFTIMPGKKLEEKIQKIVDAVGAYPHSALTPVAKQIVRAPSIQKLVCNTCSGSATIPMKQFVAGRPVTCFCGQKMFPKSEQAG